MLLGYDPSLFLELYNKEPPNTSNKITLTHHPSGKPIVLFKRWLDYNFDVRTVKRNRNFTQIKNLKVKEPLELVLARVSRLYDGSFFPNANA